MTEVQDKYSNIQGCCPAQSLDISSKFPNLFADSRQELRTEKGRHRGCLGSESKAAVTSTDQDIVSVLWTSVDVYSV
jgi:hypothetical protein